MDSLKRSLTTVIRFNCHVIFSRSMFYIHKHLCLKHTFPLWTVHIPWRARVHENKWNIDKTKGHADIICIMFVVPSKKRTYTLTFYRERLTLDMTKAHKIIIYLKFCSVLMPTCYVYGEKVKFAGNAARGEMLSFKTRWRRKMNSPESRQSVTIITLHYYGYCFIKTVDNNVM